MRCTATTWLDGAAIECRSGPPVRTRPDWVCELLSPSNAKRDLIDKLQVLHANRVPHYWIVDPLEQR